jgi:catechol 2,3-dioxygenase-like lactoylglutathione lyase family enzyme
MIGYITLGTNDFPRAAAFYDALMGEVGAKRIMDFGTFVVWGKGKTGLPGLCVTLPYDKNKATVGNGVMVALTAASKEEVDKLYQKAIALGGTDEGKPGPRGDGFYAAYFRDLDGNKLNFFHMG